MLQARLVAGSTGFETALRAPAGPQPSALRGFVDWRRAWYCCMRPRQNGAHLGGTVMVQRAREPQHQSAADAPAASMLPYDPEEWKQRVAAARAQREEVLRQRAEEQQAAERGSVGLSGRTNPPVMMPLLGVPALISIVKDEQPKAAGTIPYFISPRPFLPSWAQIKGRTPFSGRVPPMLFGLVISALAGASLVSLGATRPGVVSRKW